nr:MAG TPA: hypothetical protein [Caudoviricetes sp.]
MSWNVETIFLVDSTIPFNAPTVPLKGGQYL